MLGIEQQVLTKLKMEGLPSDARRAQEGSSSDARRAQEGRSSDTRRVRRAGLQRNSLSSTEARLGGEEAVHHRSHRIMARLRKVASAFAQMPTGRFSYFSGPIADIWLQGLLSAAVVKSRRIFPGKRGCGGCLRLLAGRYSKRQYHSGGKTRLQYLGKSCRRP